MSKILVTGANGFIGSHIVQLLLNEGHKVRGTVKNLHDKRTEYLNLLGQNAKHKLEIVEAELLNASSLERAVEDIDIIIHTATTVDLNPTEEKTVIKPSVDGTMNVLNAALKANVKRLVYTSSSFVVTGHDTKDILYTDKDWADLEKLKCVYTRAKLLAERAAWDFVEDKKNRNITCFDSAVVIPVVTLGPLLLGSLGSTTPFLFLNTITNCGIIENQYKAFCDVRDVAMAHYKAATLPNAIGKRFIITSTRKRILISDWVDIFNEEFNSKGYRSTTKFEKFDNISGNLTYDDSNMKEILNIKPHDIRETIIDMVNSFIKFNLIRPNQ